MKKEEQIQLAKDFYKGWQTKDLSLIQLTDDFVHHSPNGLFESKKAFLDACWEELSGDHFRMHEPHFTSDGEVVGVFYQMPTPDGPRPFTEWMEFKEGKIAKITVFWHQ